MVEEERGEYTLFLLVEGNLRRIHMFKYTPHFIPSGVIVYGAGGTGGWLIPRAAQLLRSITKSENPLGWLVNPTMWVVDGDEVEPKNLLRQNFIGQDVGRNKALVMAERYSRAYGVNINACQNFIGRDGRVEDDHPQSRSALSSFLSAPVRRELIHVLCVDSPVARRNVLRFIRRNFKCSSQFIIDPGNEATFGQVRFFHPVAPLPPVCGDVEHTLAQIQELAFRPERVTLPYIPLDGQHYLNLSAGAGEVSCADLDQTMAINNEIAAVCFSVIQNFFFGQMFTHRQVNVNLKGGRNEVLLTAEEVFNQCLGAEQVGDHYGVKGLDLVETFSAYLAAQEQALKAAKVSNTPPLQVEVPTPVSKAPAEGASSPEVSVSIPPLEPI